MDVLFLIEDLANHGGQRTLLSIVKQMARSSLDIIPLVIYINKVKTQTIKKELDDLGIESFAASSPANVIEYIISKRDIQVINAHVWEGTKVLKLARSLQHKFPVLFTHHGATILNRDTRDNSFHNVVSTQYPYDLESPINRPIYCIQNCLDPHEIRSLVVGKRTGLQDPIFSTIDKSKPIILTISRCVRSKGYDLFLDICDMLDEAGLDATFVFIGASASNANWGDFVKRADRDDWTFIHTPFVSHDRAIKILCAADVFLLTSRLESYCFRLYEAIAAGIPVVTHELHIGHDVRDQISISRFEDVGDMAINTVRSLKKRKEPRLNHSFMDIRRMTSEYYKALTALANGTTPDLTKFIERDVPDTIKNTEV